MTSLFQGVLDYAGQHPALAIALALLVALGEALFIVGLFVPSTVVLVGIGGLIGLGKLPFWPLFAATAAGAVIGDFLSFWLGRVFKERLVALWPFSRYAGLVASGRRYFAAHGGKSVVIGRFIPGIKAVVPGIAGMMGMGPVRFATLNVLSAIAWAAAHLLPGVTAGWALAGLGLISKRLAILAAVLTISALLMVWLVRRSLAFGARHLGQARGVLLRRATGRAGPVRWLAARLLGPEHEDFRVLALLYAIVIGATLGFSTLLDAVLDRGGIVRFDTSVSQFLQALRTAWTDALMVSVTMLGDAVVIGAVAAAAALILIAVGRFRLAAGLGLAIASAAIFVQALKSFVHASRPIALGAGSDAFSFPSGHATVAAVTYGLLALILYRGLGGRTGRVAAGTCVALVGAIGLSRVYLAAHWPSDVLAGLLFGAAITAVFALVFRGDNPGRRASAWLGVGCAAALTVSGGWHVAAGRAEAVARYAARPRIDVALPAPWRKGGWAALPMRRIDLGGATEEPFLLQWRGDAAGLRDALAATGWSPPAGWSLAALNGFAYGATGATDLPVLPKLHNGRAPALTMIRPRPVRGRAGRLTLRAWAETVETPSRAERTILVASVFAEEISHPLAQVSLPLTVDDAACPAADLLRQLPNATPEGPELRASDGACGGRLTLASP